MANFNTFDQRLRSGNPMAVACDPFPAPPWLRAEPSDWPPDTLDRDALYLDASRTTLAPGFLGLARAVAGEVLRCLDQSPTAMRVVRDMPMYLLLVCCMHLHHRRAPDKPSSGVTLTNLRELYSRRGTRRYASDTHLRDMLAWARQRGLLRPASTADGRIRPLEPTELMERIFQQWVNSFVAAGVMPLPPALVDPEGMPSKPLVYEVLSYRIMAYRVDGFVLTERFPQIQALMQRRHGYHVFLSLVADMPTDDAVCGEMPLSLSSLANRFQVSRGTVRNVLSLAETEGLLCYDGARETVLTSPGFIDLAHRWMGLEITWMSGLFRAASASLRARSEQTGVRATPT